MGRKLNNGFSHQINTERYWIEIYFYNSLEDPVAIPFFMVDSLTINESLINWWVNGNIVLNNDFEITQRDFNIKKTHNVTNKNQKHLFIDRTDGRNKISIRIIPVGENDEEYDDKEKWEMSYDLIVYDVEDLPSENIQNKLKRYYFIDERYQLFLEKNIEWSTATAILDLQTELDTSSGKITREMFAVDDSLRNLNPNIALAELIKFASKNIDGSNIKVGYDDKSSIDKPNIEMGQISDRWNTGPQDAVKIFCTSAAYHNTIDTINFLLSRCVGDNNDPVFLEFGRNSRNKRFELLSLSDILKDSKNQIERLILDDTTSPIDNPPYIPQAWIDDGKDPQTGNNHNSPYSRITQYKFSPMAPIDDMKIVNSPLHYFDTRNGEFNIIYEKNSALDVINKIKEITNNTLYSFLKSKPNSPHLLTNLNQTKKKGLMIDNKFSADPYVNDVLPSVQMIRDFLFLNQTLSFQQKGLTLRTPGKFIFVDSIISGDQNPFNNRFLGQWLISSVTHLFTKNDYVTEVIANKIDTYSKLWDVEDKNY